MGWSYVPYPAPLRGDVGELELLSLQLPQVQGGASHDQGRDDIVALRADIMELITAITIGLSDAD